MNDSWVAVINQASRINYKALDNFIRLSVVVF